MKNDLTNQTMQESNVNQQTQSYGDILRETQQEEFPLLSEVTRGIVDEPITLMNSIYDEDGVVVPCALPDAMWKSLPRGDGHQEECCSQEAGQTEQGVLHRQGASRRVREDLKNGKEQLEETMYTFCRLIC